MSSAQPRDLGGIIGEYKPEHVVVKLYLPWESIGQDWSRDQVASARAAGASVGGYCWAYRDADPAETVRAALALAASCELQLPILWLDCETYTVGPFVRDPGPDAFWLRAAIAACRKARVRPGIYTGRWWVETYLKSWSEFEAVPKWIAEYNGIADLGSVTLFGGLTRAALLGHQYAADGIDLSVFDAAAVG